ncbi:hypothetical protein Y032_0329g2651 [Ancylostoma ceylanicum]|uniref:SXP/RAL-2 family protein Ani s 5-like cation-binding domain-containing protein n=1 Tax=Ancylostoma ceylanicum TaxID=53326 RepID=A0A016RZH8_9BILA|nr:hypothetical protein Y032_0329g2651 [Ancylostoma ceylanicum]
MLTLIVCFCQQQRTRMPPTLCTRLLRVLNAEQLKEFNKFHAALQRRREEFQKKLKQLSPEARAAHEKLAKLREERHKIFMEVSDSVKEELNKLYHDERRKHMERRKRQ